MKATKRHITGAVVFVVVFFGALSLVPLFPEVRPIQMLKTSSLAFIGLWIVAIVIAMIVDRITFGRLRK
jgi:hypothetical protein